MTASTKHPQRATTRHVGSERTGSREGLPTPGSFGGLENREEVIAKPATYLEVPAYLRASTPNAAPAERPCSPAPARPTPRRVPGRRSPYLVMRDQSSRIHRRQTRFEAGRDLRLIGYGSLLTFVFVVLPMVAA